MRISHVTYRRLHSFGNYENEAIEATAELGPDDLPEEALARIKGWVLAELGNSSGQRAELRGEEQRLYDLRSEARELAKNVEVARERWEKVRAFLDRHGVTTDDLDIPF